MKIFDCFMYFDEDLVLDLRLNYLNQFVDHFIIVESVFNTTDSSLMALTLLRCSRSVELEGNLYRGLVEVRAYHRLQMRD